MSSRRTPPSRAKTSPETVDELLLAFITERESDYSRIARFLHDEVGQVLSAVGLQLDALRLDFSAQAPELEQRTNQIQQMLEPVISRLRDMSHELNPSVVQRAGLHFALNRLAVRLQDGFAGTVRLYLDPAAHVLFPRSEAMYRAAEAAAELALAAPGCTAIEIHLKHLRGADILEVRANAPLEINNETRFPVLLMNYYGDRNGIKLAIDHGGERDTIISFSCSTSQVELNAEKRSVEADRPENE